MQSSNWREILVGVLSALIYMLGHHLGMDDTARELVAVIGGGYVAAAQTSQLNIRKRFETLTEQLASKKFRFTLIYIVLAVVGPKFGFNPDWAMGVLATLMNAGFTVSDLKSNAGFVGTTLASRLESEADVNDNVIAPQFTETTDDFYGERD